MQYDLFFSSFHSVSPASRLLILIADESVIIYNKHFRIPASPRNFSRSIIVRFVATAHMRMQLFHTSACRLALRKRSEASPPAACRLFCLSPRPPGFSNFQTLSFDPQPHNEQRGPRSITAENPGASFLSPVLAPLSLSLLYPPPFVLPSRTHTNVRGTRAHARTQRRGARPFYSPRSVPPPARPALSS